MHKFRCGLNVEIRVLGYLEDFLDQGLVYIHSMESITGQLTLMYVSNCLYLFIISS